VLYGGAKGPGKSHALLYKPLRFIHRALFKVLFLRVDFPSLQENMDRAHAVSRSSARCGTSAIAGGHVPVGARYEFGYAETMKDVRRYAGREPSIICYDQIEQLADEKVWTTLLAETSLARPRPRDARRCASANPGGPGEPWLMKRFVKPCGEDGARVYVDPEEPTMTRRFIPGRVTDNPIYAKDKKYMATLRTLPKRQREQLLEGKWGIGSGRGLDELDERRHVVPAFPVPKHWTVSGARSTGDSVTRSRSAGSRRTKTAPTYLVDTIHGHKMLPWEQAERIKAGAGAARTLVHAGHDCWNERGRDGREHADDRRDVPRYGILLVRANIDRVQGLNNLREYVKWQGPDGDDVAPRFFIMDTPGNRQIVRQRSSR
jgi:hypothetical protein